MLLRQDGQATARMVRAIEPAMALLEIWFSAVGLMAGLLALSRFARSRRWPPMPLALPLLACLLWALLRTLPLGLLPAEYRVWVLLSGDLLRVYAVLRLGLWAGLELTSAIGWWRQPPKLLMQLVMVGAGGLATALLVKQTARLDLVGLVTTSAVATAVIGLAGQEALKDLFAGLELQLGDDFTKGDWLELQGGQGGIVESLSWRNTCLRTIDGSLLVVPNSKVTAEVLHNRSAFGASGDRFSIGLDYAFPPARACALLEEVVHHHPLVLEEPRPVVRLTAFGDSAITYEVQVWQQEPGERAWSDLRSVLLQQIWYALQREGQSVPYPVREIRPKRTIEPAVQEIPTPQDCCAALSRLGIFADLNADQLRKLVEGSRLVAYGPGETIVQEGAPGDCLYHLLRGQVEVVKQVAQDRNVAVRRLEPGDVFGEMTLFLDAVRSATVRSLGECLLLRVDRVCMRQLLEESPPLLERFADLVDARQAELETLSRPRSKDRTNLLVAAMKTLFFPNLES